MSENRELSSSADEDSESDIIYARHLREGQPSVDFTVSSDFKHKPYKRQTSERPGTSLASAGVSVANAINIIDTFDRPADARAEGTYAGTGTYASAFEDEPGKRVPKAGAFAEAGVGRAKAAFSVFDAEAKGPNASARAEANVVGASAIARAEVASASATAGPLGVKVGLGVDTGVSVDPLGVEVKVLGTGFTFGPRTSISLLGSEVSCSVM